MINIVFFSKYREEFGQQTIALEARGSVSEIIDELRRRYPDKTGFLSDNKLLVAINHEMALITDSLNDGDELAFFPPVTGG